MPLLLLLSLPMQSLSLLLLQQHLTAHARFVVSTAAVERHSRLAQERDAEMRVRSEDPIRFFRPTSESENGMPQLHCGCGIVVVFASGRRWWRSLLLWHNNSNSIEPLLADSTVTVWLCMKCPMAPLSAPGNGRKSPPARLCLADDTWMESDICFN